MRRLILILLALAPSSGALARCLQFDLQSEIGSVPYVVMGEVTQSNSEAVLSQDCSAAACRHSFTVNTIEVLKGQVPAETLTFEYDYLAQRPEMALLKAGQKFIFAIDSVDASGKAKLVGETCGRAGVDTSELSAVKQAIAGR